MPANGQQPEPTPDEQRPEPESLRVAISGASGLIGSHLARRLVQQGHRVDPLVRRPPRPDTTEIHWDPDGGNVDAASLAGVDVVVHLAGESIASGRWTDKKKAAIRDSRVIGTTLLAQALANVDPRPRALVTASAVGFYGDRGDETLTEVSPPGEGFLADVCQDWENATQVARDAGIRVVHVRTGVVLTPEGGALPRLLTPFKLGIAGKLGNGRQYMSWISLSDILRIYERAIRDDSLRGPVNATAPNPVTNVEFTKTLGRTLGRPTVLCVPGFALKLALGEMADEMLLASTRAVPRRLEQADFTFEHPTLEEALRAALTAGNENSDA